MPKKEKKPHVLVDTKKPFSHLFDDVLKTGAKAKPAAKKVLKKVAPGAMSLIFAALSGKPEDAVADDVGEGSDMIDAARKAELVETIMKMRKKHGK